MTQSQNERAEALAEAAATLQCAELPIEAERLYHQAATVYDAIGDSDRAVDCRRYAAECGSDSAYYATLEDARTALVNSGVLEWFQDWELSDVAYWMFNNNASPERAAKHFDVA